MPKLVPAEKQQPQKDLVTDPINKQKELRKGDSRGNEISFERLTNPEMFTHVVIRVS